MKRIMFLTLLLVMAAFVLPAYADPIPKEVEVINTPDNAVPVQGDVQVTNTVDVDVTNTSGNPVPVTVTNPSVSNAVINGINREYFLVSSPTIGQEYVLISLSSPGSFVSARFLAEGPSVQETFVVLEIDGIAIVQETLREIDQLSGRYGSLIGATTDGGRNYVLSVSFQLPVTFESSLVLKATPIGAIGAVTRMRALVTYGQ
jgi:hypothetical protein